MNNKDSKAHITYDVFIILVILLLLTFICHLWPIVLLIILGIFAALIKLLFVSSKKVEVIEPQSLPKEPPRMPTEKDVQSMAYGVILRRITELVSSEYPEARWVWEAPNAKVLIQSGEDVFILLNRAGGYRKAKVNISNLQVMGIDYQAAPVSDYPNSEETDECAEQTTSEPLASNYGLLAFEWVEAHILEINTRCNDAIGQGLNQMIIGEAELPAEESWTDICVELSRAGIKEAEKIQEGIKINLMQ